MILIPAAILGMTLLTAPQGGDQRAEAERMAKSGNYAAALKQFQALAAANPDDIDARLWIARLHAQMGHPEHAVDVYRSILAAQPQHLDALIGLGQSLVKLGRLSEAADALNRAEALAADRPAVLAALGQLHQAENRTTLALAYYERALSLDPGNREINALADVLRAERGHRVELDYDFQHLNTDVEDSHAGTFEVNARANDSLRVFGRGQVDRLFGVNDERAGGGIEWSMTRQATLRLGALFGFDPVYLPKSDVFVEAALQQGRARWGVLVQRAVFEGSDLWLGGPELTVRLTDGVDASIDYFYGRTAVEGVTNDITTDTVAVRISGPVTRRVRLGAGFTHGIDRLDWLTSDRITFEADTFSLRAACALTPFVTLELGYDFQSRPQDVQVHRARAGLTYRF
jgi:tetratricopeptide (TPR) repeat protein